MDTRIAPNYAHFVEPSHVHVPRPSRVLREREEERQRTLAHLFCSCEADSASE